MSSMCRDLSVLIADDHAAVRKVLSDLLQDSGLRVIGQAANGQEAVRECERLRPGIVVLDISMPLLNGFEAAAQIAVLSPATKIIFLTGHTVEGFVGEALRVGGVAFVLKEYAAHDLLAAIQAVLEGKTYIGRGAAA